MQRLVFQAFVLVVALLMAARSLTPDGGSGGGALAVATGPGAGPAFAGEETVLQRDASGQFRMTLAVNGLDTPFLIDTGADVVALTEETAQELGLGIAPEDMQPMLRTASGTGYGAPVTLDVLELGEASFRDVPGVVVRGLDENLLGQSLLRRLGKVELRGDSMVIRHL